MCIKAYRLTMDFSMKWAQNPLEADVASEKEFIKLIKERDDIIEGKILDYSGKFHNFLTVVIDGEIAAGEQLDGILPGSHDVMVFNAIAGG